MSNLIYREQLGICDRKTIITQPQGVVHRCTTSHHPAGPNPRAPKNRSYSIRHPPHTDSLEARATILTPAIHHPAVTDPRLASDPRARHPPPDATPTPGPPRAHTPTVGTALATPHPPQPSWAARGPGPQPSHTPFLGHRVSLGSHYPRIVQRSRVSTHRRPRPASPLACPPITSYGELAPHASHVQACPRGALVGRGGPSLPCLLGPSSTSDRPPLPPLPARSKSLVYAPGSGRLGEKWHFTCPKTLNILRSTLISPLGRHDDHAIITRVHIHLHILNLPPEHYTCTYPVPGSTCALSASVIK